MSEAQRRYLFRLYAAQGVEMERAHEEILERLQVESITDVTKADATRLIDELLAASAPDRGGGSRGERTPRLQR
jgi:hypothetical protein